MTESRTLTLAQLVTAGACLEQRDLFESEFGTSVKVTAELAESFAGRFDFGWAAENLLSSAAQAECEKVRAAAQAECEKVGGAAWAEYEKVRGAAWAEYEKVRAAAQAEYEKVRAAAWARAYIDDREAQ